MTSGIHAKKVKEYREYEDGVFQRIREILEQDWDPIELYQKVWMPGEAPDDWEGELETADWPRGEYEECERTLFFMLNAEFTKSELVKMLGYWADEWIGESIPFEKNCLVAEKLLEIPLKKEGWH